MKNSQYPWFMLASTYVTQYIGVAFILSAAVAILRQQGAALDQLALLNLAVLPLAGKVFYAPIIDKFHVNLRYICLVNLQGRYRSWLVLAQLAMTLLLILAGALDFETQFSGILLVLACYVFFMSIQDVSIDGLSCKLFDSNTRKFANSVQFSGNLLGNIIGGGLILMFYPWLEWQGSLWLLAALTAISLVQMLFFKEPDHAAETTQQNESAHHLLKDIKQFILKHKRWFLLLGLYPIGSTCGFALLNPLLVDQGWPLEDIGFVMKIYGSIVGLFSALLATPLINQIGRTNALVTVTFIQFTSLIFVLFLTLGTTSKIMVYAAITLHFISFPAMLVVSSTIMMDKAALTLRKATFFTLQFSVASLLGFAYSAASLALAKHLQYSGVVAGGAVITLLIACVIRPLLKESLMQASSPCSHATR